MKQLFPIRGKSCLQLQSCLTAAELISKVCLESSRTLPNEVATFLYTSTLKAYTVDIKTLSRFARVFRQRVMEKCAIRQMIPKSVSCTYCKEVSERQILYTINFTEVFGINYVLQKTMRYYCCRYQNCLILHIPWTQSTFEGLTRVWGHWF